MHHRLLKQVVYKFLQKSAQRKKKRCILTDVNIQKSYGAKGLKAAIRKISLDETRSHVNTYISLTVRGTYISVVSSNIERRGTQIGNKMARCLGAQQTLETLNSISLETIGNYWDLQSATSLFNGLLPVTRMEMDFIAASTSTVARRTIF